MLELLLLLLGQSLTRTCRCSNLVQILVFRCSVVLLLGIVTNRCLERSLACELFESLSETPLWSFNGKVSIDQEYVIVVRLPRR
jgi:hypothetical protein